MAESKKEVVPESVRAQEGNALRLLIEASKFNQQTLAAESGVGTKAFLWQVVSGHRPLNLETASRLAKTLEVRIDDFSPRLASTVRDAAMLVLPPNYVREPSGGTSDTRPANAPIPISRVAEPTRAYGWPFKSVSPSEYAEISPEGRAELDAIVRGMLIEARGQGKSGAR